MRYNLKPLVLDHVNSFLQSTFSPDGVLLAIKGRASDTSTREEADSFSHVFVWSTQTGDLYAHFQDYAIAQTLFAPKEKILATVHSNCVCLRDPATGEVWQTLLEDLQPAYTVGFWSLAFSPDGSRLAAGRENIDSLTSAYVVDLGEGSRVIPLSIHDETVKDAKNISEKSDLEEEDFSDRDNHSVLRCQFLTNRLLLGTGYVYDSEDCVYLWDLQTGKKLLTFGPDDLRDEGKIVRHLIFSPDGRFLIAASIDDSEAASLWQLTERDGKYQWQRRSTFGAPNDSIVLGNFSPDGQTFAVPQTEGPDATGAAPKASGVTLWDTASGRKRASITMQGRFYCFAFTPDGKTLAAISGSPKRSYWRGAPEYLLHLWDAQSGQERALLRTKGRDIDKLFHEPRRAEFSPDGFHLVVCHLSHAELWDLTSILDANAQKLKSKIDRF